jgi:hypothetical protein
MKTSNRTFGIEIEIDALENDIGELSDMVSENFHTTTDSSIIGANPIEIVSRVLRGKSGEKAIVDLCRDLKNIEVDPTGINSGFHVHLGAEEFVGEASLAIIDRNEALQVVSAGEVVLHASFQAIRSYRGHSEDYRLSNEDYLRFFSWVRGEIYEDYSVIRSCGEDFICTYKVNGIHNYFKITQADFYKIEKFPREEIRSFFARKLTEQNKGKYAMFIPPNDEVDRLKNVLLTYVVFNDVISGMVPDSRKVDNSYCRRVSETYTIDEILAVKTITEFQQLWYLEPDPRELRAHYSFHYENSRYQDVNLHSIWNRTNTIEIRSHKSTIEPKLIINWMRFHRQIIDCVVDGTLNQKNILPGSKLTSLEDKVLYLLEIIGADDEMQKYVKTLINHYNYLSL